jgi:hypothetical protein
VRACGLIGAPVDEAAAGVIFAKCKGSGAGPTAVGGAAPAGGAAAAAAARLMAFEGFVQAAAHGRTVQLDPWSTPAYRAWSQRFYLTYDGALSNFIFSFNLRRYSTWRRSTL